MSIGSMTLGLASTDANGPSIKGYVIYVSCTYTFPYGLKHVWITYNAQYNVNNTHIVTIPHCLGKK